MLVIISELSQSAFASEFFSSNSIKHIQSTYLFQAFSSPFLFLVFLALFGDPSIENNPLTNLDKSKCFPSNNGLKEKHALKAVNSQQDCTHSLGVFSDRMYVHVAFYRQKLVMAIFICSSGMPGRKVKWEDSHFKNTHSDT